MSDETQILIIMAVLLLLRFSLRDREPTTDPEDEDE